MDLDFDKLFKITTTSLNLSRLHPYLKRTKQWFIQIILLQGYMTSIFTLVMYNIVCIDFKINNFTRTCRDGVVAIVYLVVTFQFFVLIFSNDALLTLIKNVKNDYELSKTLTPDERSVVKSYADKGNYVCKQWLVIAISATCAFVSKSVFLNFYYYYLGEYQFVQFYELTFPESITQYTDNIIGNLLIYVYLCTYSTYATVMYAAYCPLGPMFMLHCCGQLEIVKMRLDSLFVELDDKIIKEKLNDIIQRLQYIYNFVDIIKNIFKVPYELTLKATTLILPVTFYEVIEAAKRREVSLEFISFIFGGILISSSPCYYSDLLKEKGEDVRQAVYCSGWELQHDRRTRTTLLVLLLNALRPIAIRTVFRTLCLDALTDLFQEAYTIFNLMNAMWN